MSDYLSVKIKEDLIEKLKVALKTKGIDARSNAEAVNTVIYDFLLKNYEESEEVLEVL